MYKTFLHCGILLKTFYSIFSSLLQAPDLSSWLWQWRRVSSHFVEWWWGRWLPCNQLLWSRLPGRKYGTGREAEGNGAWRKLRSADVTFPRNQAVLVSPLIIHHFVYKWEIAFYSSVSSKRLKLIWNNTAAKAPIKASGRPCSIPSGYWHDIIDTQIKVDCSGNSESPGSKSFHQRRCSFLKTRPT